MILAPFCEEVECEERIKKDSTREDASGVAMGAKSLCIPFEQAPIEADAKVRLWPVARGPWPVARGL